MGASIDYLVATASGLSVAILGAMAAGARSWAHHHTDQLNGLGERLTGRLDRTDRRIESMAAEQSYDRERIVRVETALLFSQSPPEGARRALEALVEFRQPPGAPGPQKPPSEPLGGIGQG